MKNHKKYQYGAYWSDRLIGTDSYTIRSIKNGKVYYSRPVPYYSFMIRLKQALDVLRYKADALYWDVDEI
jgi:hypothetical protein